MMYERVVTIRMRKELWDNTKISSKEVQDNHIKEVLEKYFLGRDTYCKVDILDDREGLS